MLDFYWAVGQWQSNAGETNTSWIVSLGSETFQTPLAANVSQGFVPWTLQSFVFSPTTASAVLTFLSSGEPFGLPPAALLDGVSLNAVPEPAAWAMMLIGLTLTGGVLRARRGRVLVAN